MSKFSDNFQTNMMGIIANLGDRDTQMDYWSSLLKTLRTEKSEIDEFDPRSSSAKDFRRSIKVDTDSPSYNKAQTIFLSLVDQLETLKDDPEALHYLGQMLSTANVTVENLIEWHLGRQDNLRNEKLLTREARANEYRNLRNVAITVAKSQDLPMDKNAYELRGNFRGGVTPDNEAADKFYHFKWTVFSPVVEEIDGEELIMEAAIQIDLGADWWAIARNIGVNPFMVGNNMTPTHFLDLFESVYNCNLDSLRNDNSPGDVLDLSPIPSNAHFPNITVEVIN